MDNFNVPKKVNRHVLKALNILCSGNFKEGITTARICHQVKYQMRNLVPVPDIDYAIQKSLKNLSEVGLIERQGHTRFCLGRNYAPPPTLIRPSTTPNHTQPDKRIFRTNENKQKSRSTLDPNLKRNCNSDDSLSGDDFDKTRKRMRSNNKQLRHSGRTTILPRARQHKCSMKIFEMQTLANNQNIITTTASENSNAYIGQVVAGNVKNSAVGFMAHNVSPVPSLEITEITDEPIKSMKSSQKNVNETIEKPDEVMVDAQEPKLEVQQNSSVVQHPSSRTSGTNLGENPSTQKLESEVARSSSQASAHSQQKAKEAAGRPDVTLSYIN